MASGNNIMGMSPRQRMINLMYIVLTAMLALNVSSDVLNGFSQVNEGIKRTNQDLATRNETQYEYLSSIYEQNPLKAGHWMEKGELLRKESNNLISSIDTIMVEIAKEADGKNGNPNILKNLDDLEAASVTLLNPTSEKGAALKNKVDNYRTLISSLISDSIRSVALTDMLATDLSTPEKSKNGFKTWEEYLFDNTPAIAAITILTKLQNDIRQAENEALSSIIENVDIGDVRVNQLNPYVIAKSNMVMLGGKYTANIVMAAVDTTQRPAIYIEGNKLNNEKGLLEIHANSTGVHEFNGYIELARPDGQIQRHPFTSSYTVMEPMATISPTLMNVLYAGIENPISISVPGVPQNAVQANMTNGTLTRSGNGWMAKPDKIGSDATITVTATIDGINQQAGAMTFRVRKLPDPSPFIPIKDGQGNLVEYKGSPRKLSKAALMGAETLDAAIDDNLLNVAYSVVSFSTVFFDSMGNAIPEVSEGNKFSTRQKEQFRRLKPGKSFFITDVKAKGPDGVTRDIPPMQVSLN